MFSYPVQRHSWPEIASRISSSDGSGLWSSSQRAVIIMPGVQKPHCSPWQATKPCCTGSSSAPCARPSTVRTSWPSAITASTVHDLTGVPSNHTAHTPQLEVSQPQWVPVSPSSSRRKCTSSSRGSTSRVYSSPFTVTVICMSRLLSLGAGGGAAQRPRGELAGEMPLVVDRAALVGGRLAVLRRRSGRPRRSPPRPAVRRAGSPRPPRPRSGAPTAVSPIPASVIDPVGDLQHRSGGGDRPVADPALDLLVRAAAAGRMGTRISTSSSARPATVSYGPRWNSLIPMVRLPPGPWATQGRPQRRERRGQVLRRIGLAQRAAHGAAVAYERIGDDPFRVPQDREVLADDRRREQFRVAGHRSDGQLVARPPG